VNKKLNILSNITRHDILNQITVLSTYTDILRLKISDPAVLDYVNKEDLAIDAIRRQITFTREYQNIGIHSPVWQNIHNTIKETTTSLKHQEIKLFVEVHDIEVLADPLLEKVFFNLVDNATKHGEKITYIRFTSTESKEGLIIICEDDGAGIPIAEKENIFNRRYFKHTGFGLYLSREILGITGLTIKETGEPGKGARFEIFIPEGRYRILTEKGS